MRYTLAEMAALDAMGLLDAEERRTFASAIESCSLSDQQRVQDVQDAVVASGMELLPSIEPDPSLRKRVLDYVCHYIDRDFKDSFVPASAGVSPPRVSIFRRRGDWFENNVIGGRVSPLWRVAALIFASATLSFALVSYDAYSINREVMRKSLIPDGFSRVVEQYFGRSVESFLLDPDVNLVQFRPAQRGSGITALLSVTEDGQAVLLLDGLPRTMRPYRLYGQAEGKSEPMLLAEFEARPEGGTAVDFEAPGELLARNGKYWVEGFDPVSGEVTTIVRSVA